jgi:hypothetical protein
MMRSFVDLLECANLISEGVSTLCALGHFSALSFGTERDDRHRSANTLEELKELKETVECVSDAWRQALMMARLKNYILSFFCSTQLGALCDMTVGDEKLAAHDLMRFVPAPTDRSLAGMGGSVLDINLSFGNGDADIRRLTALGQMLGQVFAVEEEGKKDEGKKKRALSFQRKKQRGKQRGVSSGEMCLYFVKSKGTRSLILEGMMSLYAAEGVLPHRCQLLFCQPTTFNEEIDAFCHRAFYAPSSPLTKDRLFCFMQIDQLSEETYLHLVRICPPHQNTPPPPHHHHLAPLDAYAPLLAHRWSSCGTSNERCRRASSALPSCAMTAWTTRRTLCASAMTSPSTRPISSRLASTTCVMSSGVRSTSARYPRTHSFLVRLTPKTPLQLRSGARSDERAARIRQN